LPAVPVSEMRTSAADRERAVDVLKAAFAEGRLDQDEYTERMASAYTSRTYGQLAALTADLPIGPLGALAPQLASSAEPAQTVEAAEPAVPQRAVQQPMSGMALASAGLGVAGLGTTNEYTALPAVLLGIFALLSVVSTGKRGAWLACVGLLLGLYGMFFALVA
jgi:Domain of unknown function (DUF1707)